MWVQNSDYPLYDTTYQNIAISPDFSLKQGCFAGIAQTLPDETSPLGKIQQNHRKFWTNDVILMFFEI